MLGGGTDTLGAGTKARAISLEWSIEIMEKPDSNAVVQTVANLSRIFEKQLGCSMGYTWREEFSHRDLFGLLNRGEPVRIEDSIYFPVFFHEELAGAAHIVTTQDFEAHMLRHLHGVIRLMIENRMSQIENVDVLSELEENLIAQQEREQHSHGNVFRLSDYQANPYPLPENKINKAFSFAFLLQSQDQEDIFKMALEIHTRSGRYAFLPLRDLSPDVFSSAAMFKNLGPISVFLPEVTTLTKEQQATLLAYYRGPRDKDCPQIIAGTALSVAQLKQDGRVLPDLLQYLSVGFLAMNKPFALYKRENLLDFFYDSLTGRTSI